MIETIAWLVLAAVHLIPALAVFTPSLLTRMYGLDKDNPLFLLMHHRAALFLAIFVMCIWGSFDPRPRQMAGVVVAISMVSFLLLYWLQGAPTALRRIAIVDLVGLPALATVVWQGVANM